MMCAQTGGASAPLCIRADSQTLCELPCTCLTLCTLNGRLSPSVARSIQVTAVASCARTGGQADTECFSCANSCCKPLKQPSVYPTQSEGSCSGGWKPQGFWPWTSSVSTSPSVHKGVLPPADSQFCEWYFFFNIKLSDGLNTENQCLISNQAMGLTLQIESHKNGDINVNKMNANFVFS